MQREKQWLLPQAFIQPALSNQNNFSCLNAGGPTPYSL